MGAWQPGSVQRARRAIREQTCAGDRRIMTAKSRRIIYIMSNRCGQVSIHAPRVGRDGERVADRGSTANGSPTRGRGWFQFTRPAWGATGSSNPTISRTCFNSRVPRGARRGERRLHFARAGAGARFRAAGRERINSPFPCVFLIPALRDSRAKIMRKKIFCGWCTMGKIRKNPNKTGVFGVKKKFAWGG